MAGYKILEIDPLLKPFKKDIDLRMENLKRTKNKIIKPGEKLKDYANGHLFFGFHRSAGGWVYREWAPNAHAISVFGDFNGWDRNSHELHSIGNGNWEINVPGEIPHGSKVRIQIRTSHETFERIPSYCKRVVQDGSTGAFDGQIWSPPHPFEWGGCAGAIRPGEPLMIYESHVGMSGEADGIATYTDYAQNVLPRAAGLGYNAVQLMAIQEHPYYGSFGYQISNFFAVSSRFGTPEELKALIDKAHGMGIAVLLDLVHSHAVKNEMEGLGRFDGTVYQYFHAGSRGEHPEWSTRLFNYGKPEVLHFLLSNIKFWLDEYHFDGFRFDGVTSMLYHDHGLGVMFDDYSKYFSLNTDTEAITYLQLAAELTKEENPDAVLISEDMSGMPGMCLPIEYGGIGFDYRLGMGIPDFWIRTLKTKKDEDWDTGSLWYELNQRRPGEKVIGYCESHDQALVGDKTLMFRMADKEMYWNMNVDSQSQVIDRAIALHKLIRLITCVCAGEGYLNFMGNEFGHPEWIDFPREGNNNSYHYARRQWSLVDNNHLRYRYLKDFDSAMVHLAKNEHLPLYHSDLLLHSEKDKILAFNKGAHLFVFNFHPVNDFTVKLPFMGADYAPVLDSNWKEFGGYKNRYETPLIPVGNEFHIKVNRREALVYRALDS